MRGTFVFCLIVAALGLSSAGFHSQTRPPPYINRPTLPPSTGPHRFRREANPKDHGSISITQTKPLSGPERRPSYNVDYNHNIWKGRNGEITAGGGAQKLPGQRWEPTVGVQGTWRFKREANPKDHGSISVTQTKPLSGPERRPSYNVDYNHNIWKGRNGQITAGGGAQKLPGQRWEPTVGVQGTWRFKREANPKDHGSISITQTKPLSGPERRPSYNVDYNHNIWKGRNGQITAGGGAQKLPGQRWEPTVGVQGTWRFKREANPKDHGSISVTQTKPLSGPERRPSYNVDYNHNIWKGRNGQITAGGGAQKLPGQRWEPTVGVQGTWRFKREANPKDHGSISVTQTKPLSGPERRPSYNVDYNHNIWKGRNGQITAGGGAQKLPGQRWEPTVGVQGTWRFKREANPKDHGSISITQTKPLSGPERRPSYNVDYNHNIWKGRNGEITAGGGAQKLPGQRWEPTVGVQGTWRFKREANPKDHGSISVTQTKPLSGPERRPSYNVDYNHNIWKGRNGQITAGGGAQKLPGQRWEPTVGVQGTWRFKREANPKDHGSISVTQTKPLSGPERRPSYNVDYNHNIWKGRNGEITAGGGAQKLPGQRWEPTVGVQGTWRFKREANPKDHGSISITQTKPLSGPERRPSYNVDYNHNIWKGRNGEITAGGGAQKLPGQRWEPSVGIQGVWRF